MKYARTLLAAIPTAILAAAAAMPIASAQSACTYKVNVAPYSSRYIFGGQKVLQVTGSSTVSGGCTDGAPLNPPIYPHEAVKVGAKTYYIAVINQNGTPVWLELSKTQAYVPDTALNSKTFSFVTQ